MSLYDLKQKYNGKTNSAFNAAVRAELIGGAELLDAIHAVHALHAELAQTSSRHAERADYTLQLLRRAQRKMRDEIARRYEIGNQDDEIA
jgi:hypothetical protein